MASFNIKLRANFLRASSTLTELLFLICIMAAADLGLCSLPKSSFPLPWRLMTSSSKLNLGSFVFCSSELKLFVLTGTKPLEVS